MIDVDNAVQVLAADAVRKLARAAALSELCERDRENDLHGADVSRTANLWLLTRVILAEMGGPSMIDVAASARRIAPNLASGAVDLI